MIFSNNSQILKVLYNFDDIKLGIDFVLTRIVELGKLRSLRITLAALAHEYTTTEVSKYVFPVQGRTLPKTYTDLVMLLKLRLLQRGKCFRVYFFQLGLTLMLFHTFAAP